MYDKEQLIDALDSVTWYNGLAEYILKWKKTPLLKTHDDYPNWLSPKAEFFYSWPEGGKEQLQVIWMICVILFGDYGTSPRSGWIEKKDEFYQFLDDITRTWRESDEYEEAEEEGTPNDDAGDGH